MSYQFICWLKSIQCYVYQSYITSHWYENIVSFLPPFEGRNDIPSWKTKDLNGDWKNPGEWKNPSWWTLTWIFDSFFSLKVKNLLTISLKIFEFWIKIKDSNQSEWKNLQQKYRLFLLKNAFIKVLYCVGQLSLRLKITYIGPGEIICMPPLVFFILKIHQMIYHVKVLRNLLFVSN